MRVVLQRVSRARVTVDGDIGHAGSEIGEGLCILVGIAPSDTERQVSWISDKIANLRIFEDEEGKMNRSLAEIEGSVLAVSQFTLYADCRKGRRPSFTAAAGPELGEKLYDLFVEKMRETGLKVETGVFGAEMTVDIVNKGPVTIILDSDDMPSGHVR